MVAKSAYALCAIVLLAGCKAQEPANQANTVIPSAETHNTANNAPPTHEQALAMMKQRHDDMEAFGDETKKIGNALKSSSPDIAAIQQSAAKICNNMILGATMAATCEGFVLAQKLGLDPQVFYDISSQASGQSWSMTSYCPVPGVGPKTPADSGYEGGFAAALMLKDLKLAMEAAKDAGVDTEMGEDAEELYEEFVEKGGGSKDFSGLIKMIDGSWNSN